MKVNTLILATKLKPSGKGGLKHLWMIIHESRYLPLELRVIVDRVIQRTVSLGISRRASSV
jgi:hypothetical protein